MRQVKLFVCAVLVTTVAGLIAYPAFAHCGKCAADAKKLAGQLDQSKFTLDKAVKAAEEHSKGRAISVLTQFDDDHKMALNVWCVTGKETETPKIMKCDVDPATGKVATMKEVKEFPNYDEKAEGSQQHSGKTPTSPTHGDGAARIISDQTVDAACGVCIYKMKGVSGCPLAVKIDGKTYLVEGAEWPNHDYCDRNCRAVVTGRIEGDKFIATKLEPVS